MDNNCTTNSYIILTFFLLINIMIICFFGVVYLSLYLFLFNSSNLAVICYFFFSNSFTHVT